MDSSRLPYYEQAYVNKEFEKLNYLAVSYHDEEFTYEDELQDIVRNERKYTRFVKQVIRSTLKLTLNISSRYILGFGSTSVVYEVSDSRGEIYAAKFTWRESDFSNELLAYYRIKHSEAAHLFPRLYYSYFEHQPVELPYVDLDGKTATQTLKAFGILVQDRAQMNLSTYLRNNKATPSIKQSFVSICNELYGAGLVHADLSFNNVSVNPQTLELGFLDYADVKESSDTEARDEFFLRIEELLGRL